MTTTSDSSGAMPTDDTRPNWSWLQEKIDSAQIDPVAVAQLDDWIEQQLSDLESSFAEFVTVKSLGRSLQRSR